VVDGQRFRLLTFVDNHSRESLAIEAGQRLTRDDVVRVLEQVTSQRGKPQSIRVDNGPEFVSQSLDLWAYFNDVKLDLSRPGKPTDNAVIESFNGRLRDECLNQHWFLSLDEARAVTHGVEGGLQPRPSAWCSGQPDAIGVRAAGSWACSYRPCTANSPAGIKLGAASNHEESLARPGS
jgi:transposase InsO family protein